MSKAKIIDKKSVDSILGEKNLLSELHHPFIVNMIYSFQDHDYLYLVMDLLPGGNLRYHLGIKKKFNEKQIKFLIGCIMIGLKYIHGQNILHRDIKPENLVFDNNGYLRITDFGIAKHYVINNKKDTSGTIGYLAPEVLCNVNHNFSIDYYAVGIITYELMYGHRPYLGKTKHEVKQLILTRQAEINYNDLPIGFSNETADFINRLIQRKPANRLGKDSINEVIDHPWFDEFDWENVYKKKLKAPYIPKLGDNFDKKYCLQSNKIGTDTMERYKKIMMDENYKLIFRQFNCNRIPEELKGNSSKKTNENFYNITNNMTSNISTTSISRNNKNENKQSNLIGNAHMHLLNKNFLQNKNKINKYKTIGENNDFDKEIFKQIAILNKTLHNLSLRNKNNNINNNNNIQNKNKQSNNNGFIYNKNNMTLFRNKDNYLNQHNISNKTFRNENNIYKKNINENINNNFLDISSIIKQINNVNDNSKSNTNNQKNNFLGLDNDNDNNFLNEKSILKKMNIGNGSINHNHNKSVNILNETNKTKKLINNISIEDQSSIFGLNSGILKNMKHQYQELYPNKRNKYLNFSIIDNSKIQKISNNISNNINNNESNLNNTLFYKKINNNMKKHNYNNIKRNINMSMPKTKKDFIRREIFKNSTMYIQNKNQNNSKENSNFNINLNKKSSVLIPSTIYTKKRTNLSGLSIINNPKKLTSSHSMQNIKENNNSIIEGKIVNNSLNNKKYHFMNADGDLKNVSLIGKKLPFINIPLNKKNEDKPSNEICYSSYGKIININDKVKNNRNGNININYEFLTDRIRNKKIKNNDTKSYYNNKSVNNFLDNYLKNFN